jgi:hypothetical protein
MKANRREGVMDTLETLMKARAEVAKGWCRFNRVNLHGDVCALGAVQVACGMSRDVYETYRDPAPSVPDAVADALNAAIPDGYDHLVHSKHVHGFMAYNDAVTTKEAVLELFDRAIAAEAVKVTSDPAHVHQVAA